MILVRYSELFLKSESVRRRWESILVGNIRAGIDAEVVSKRHRIFVHAPLAEAQPVLEKVFGVHSFSEVAECPNDLDSLKQAALPLLGEGSFAVRTNRADKTYPMNSQDVSKEVGAFLVEKKGQKVNLSAPDSEVFIELFDGTAFLFSKKLPGPGGLPLGTGGRLLLLNDSDDAVLAGWLMMKRGCTLDIVGPEAPVLEQWAIGHPLRYASSPEDDYAAVVSGATSLDKLGEGTIFYPLIGFTDAMKGETRRKVFKTPY